MILLRPILTEITFGASQPYATQFIWQDYSQGWFTEFADDAGNLIQVFFDNNVQEDDPETDSAFELSFFVNNSYNADPEKTGQTNYIRIMATIAIILEQFIKRADYPYIIEFTGSDEDPEKAAQKTRLYKLFATSNNGILARLGYRYVTSHMGTGIERID